MNPKVLAIFAMALVFIAALGAVFYMHRIGERDVLVERNTEVAGTEDEGEKSRRSPEGRECANPERRPIAVMIAEDQEARPLSGIAFADIVIEMPVVTGSITRMMAIFICEDSEEIGSIRSARHDFIPLAQGYDAIFAHWGGSQLALDEFRKGVIDNLDAMPNYFETFYRKEGIFAPHDGFTSMERMLRAAENLGYRMTTNFEGYKLLNFKPQIPNLKQIPNTKPKKLEINYKYPYNVRYDYNMEANSYRRWRGGAEEIDALNGEQVETKNVVVMRAKSRQIGGGYNDVDILGSGEAVIYRNGEEIKGSWVKKSAEDALIFLDKAGEEIAFAPGKIWIEVVEPSTIVNYELWIMNNEL